MSKKLLSFASLIFSDIAVILLSFWLAYLIRSEILPNIIVAFQKIYLLPFSSLLLYPYVVLVWIFVFAYEKLYTKRYPFWEEVKILLKSATLSFSIIMILIFISKKQAQFSRTIVVLAYALSLLLFPISRYLVKIFLVKFNIWKKKLIILGVHQTSLLILKSIKKNKTMGYEAIGFLDNDPEKIGKKYLGLKVIGPFSELEKIANTYQSRDIMVTTPHWPRKKLRELLTKCENLSESMWLIPRSGDFITEGVEIEVIGEILTLHIKKNLEKPWNILIKTLFEKCLTFILIILFLPLFTIIAIAIKLDSKGPVFYIQNRLGQRNRMFRLFKFRSMYINSEGKLFEYLDKNQEAKKEWEYYKKLKNHDPRVTRIGRIIRRYSLDELPQLLNIILGTMSLVGPRPYLMEELEGRDAFKNILTKVKPGVTGLWQISGRSELPFKERISIDEYYIRNWSLWLDIIILLKSIKVLFSSKGAF
jgi:undecaprenyl-phosphate galactose phosphotransferase